MKNLGQGFREINFLAHYSILLNIVLLLAVLGLVTSINFMLPLKEIQPMLVTFASKEKQLVQIEPLKKGLSGFDLLLEYMAQDYVYMRENIDLQTEVLRWGKVIKQTSPELAKIFAEDVSIKNEKSPLILFKAKNMVREVEILEITDLAPIPNAWRVEWRSLDKNASTGEVKATKTWVSKLRAELQQHEINAESRYDNLIGFTVIDYKVIAKGA
jgi:type IV secretory pathway component VirB8